MYADVFDYPVTAGEIHRYLMAHATDLETVQQALDASLLPRRRLESQDGYFFLPGRAALVPLRQHRAHLAWSLWQHAVAYGAWVGRLPFVRMVAVTGALAVDNVGADADIDYLIVTEPGRLWLCRALVIGLVRWAKLRGHVICPNYFLSESALVLYERNLYTAHELAQMVPIVGFPTYDRMRQLNTWADDLLPNAKGLPRPIAPAPDSDPPSAGDFWTGLRSSVERILHTPVAGAFCARLEAWEMRRKIDKFQRQVARTNGGAVDAGEVAFCADWCKGHFAGHEHAVLRSFAQRLEQVSNTPIQRQPVRR